uniref:Uncharacterized protein n=1 Tax=Rhizophora mucronata TaxID=61149 RepID=A0A2P2MXC1_RHIMU
MIYKLYVVERNFWFSLVFTLIYLMHLSNMHKDTSDLD